MPAAVPKLNTASVARQPSRPWSARTAGQPSARSDPKQFHASKEDRGIHLRFNDGTHFPPTHRPWTGKGRSLVFSGSARFKPPQGYAPNPHASSGPDQVYDVGKTTDIAASLASTPRNYRSFQLSRTTRATAASMNSGSTHMPYMKATNRSSVGPGAYNAQTPDDVVRSKSLKRPSSAFRSSRRPSITNGRKAVSNLGPQSYEPTVDANGVASTVSGRATPRPVSAARPRSRASMPKTAPRPSSAFGSSCPRFRPTGSKQFLLRCEL